MQKHPALLQLFTKHIGKRKKRGDEEADRTQVKSKESRHNLHIKKASSFLIASQHPMQKASRNHPYPQGLVGFTKKAV